MPALGRPPAMYGAEHQKLRAHLIRQLNELGTMPCARCAQPIYPWHAVDLDHDDDRTSYRGLAHVRCNRQAGARKGNAMRGMRRRIARATTQPQRTSTRSRAW